MYKEHRTCASPENEGDKVWRYLDFTKFVAMIDQNACYFARSDNLSDQYEGTYTEKNREQLELLIESIRLDENLNPEEAERNKHDMISVFGEGHPKDEVLICSWRKNEFESAAMWKLYLKSNEGVAIQSTFKRLKDSFSKYPHNIHIGKVKYIDYKTEMIDYGNMLEPFLYKRKSFEHECEIRVLTKGGGWSKHSCIIRYTN